MSNKKVIIVLGPTASGKSSLALALAKKYNGYLISADSRQVYKDMNIGTNKDKGFWRDGKYYLVGKKQSEIQEQKLNKKEKLIEEYLVDFVDPADKYNLVDWLEQTKKVINNNLDRLPIIVGGTGLYISALVNEYELPGGYDEKLRIKLEKEVAVKGLKFVIQKLKKIDQDIEAKIDVTNPRRVIRSAEIILQTKQPLQMKTGESEFDFLQLGISLPREQLYAKIDKRVDEMIDEGLVEEVKFLIAKGYDCKSSAMSGIGYRQICQFLQNEISGAEAVRLVKRDTRRYAKRQLSWFKRDEQIYWINDSTEAEQLMNNFLKQKKTPTTC